MSAAVDKPGRCAGRWPDQKPQDQTVTVPPVFFADWVSCACNCDPVEWWPEGRKVRAQISTRDRADLLSRAEYYADHSEYEIGLRSSARATVRALEGGDR